MDELDSQAECVISDLSASTDEASVDAIKVIRQLLALKAEVRGDCVRCGARIVAADGARMARVQAEIYVDGRKVSICGIETAIIADGTADELAFLVRKHFGRYVTTSSAARDAGKKEIE